MELVLGESVYGNEVEPNEVTEDMIEIPVPGRAQLTMKSTIITVKYFVHVTLDIPHNIDLHINLPVVVTNKCALLAAQHSESESQSDGPRPEEGQSVKERRSKRMGSNNHSTGSSNLDTD